MKNRFKNQLFIILGLIVMITIVGCSSTSSTNSNQSNSTVANEDSSKENESNEEISNEETSNEEESDGEYINTDSSKIDYLLCNATSQGNMAEIESGFYYLIDSWLYYADRSNMTNWVFVCNKPDCIHGLANSQCHAKIGHEMAQKEDKLYYNNELNIYQVAKDGSEPEIVFKLPLSHGNGGSSYRAIISQEAFVYQLSVLGEKGKYIDSIFRLEDDGSLHTLFSKTSESLTGHFTIPSYLNQVRGDFTIMSSMLVEKGENVQNVLFRMDGDKPERVNLPEDVLVIWSYLTEDTFTYYKQNQGFFKIDLESGKETCILKNQLTDARGYVLTEDYMIECNRYLDYKPEEAYLKFYDGKNWLNVELPEIVKKTDYYFSPVSVASDRIFVKLGLESTQLYYFMLNERHPKLILATTIGDEDGEYFVIPDEEEEKGDISLLKEVDITIFETEEYVQKVIGIGYDPEEPERYQIKVRCENKTDETVTMYNDYMSMNGISFLLGKGIEVGPNKIVEDIYIPPTFTSPKIEYDRQVTNVILSSYVQRGDNTFTPIITTSIYPYGEENATITLRESLPTDEVILDNEFVKITAIEFSEKEKENLNNPTTVRWVIQNKTDQRIKLAVNELLSVDEKIIDKEMNLYTIIMPNSYGYYDMSVFDSWIKEYQIGDKVEEYRVNLGIYTNTENRWHSDEDLLHKEEVVLNPKR